jgi:hypothetical protein
MRQQVFGWMRRNGRTESGNKQTKIHYKATVKRPSTSDVQVAMNHVAHQALVTHMNNAASPVLPTDWTHGYGLPASETDLANGHQRVEGGWVLDPAGLLITQAQYETAVEQVQQLNKPAATEALQQSWVRTGEMYAKMAAAAQTRLYQFQPRDGDLVASLNWTSSIHYELAARAMERMWATLRLSRIPLHHTIMESFKSVFRAQLSLLMREQQESSPMLHSIEQTMWKTLDSASAFATQLQTLGVRLLLQAKDIDPDNDGQEDDADETISTTNLPRGVFVPAGQLEPALVESMFFGQQHATVEHEINLAAQVDGLQYLFSPESGVPAFTQHPMFAYTMDRVLIADRRPTTPQELDAIPIGLRIRIPPAPRGYLRGHVVLRFRSWDQTQERELGILPTATTDAVFVGYIPDQAAFFVRSDGGDGDGQDDTGDQEARTVSDLTASFILFLSEPSEVRAARQETQEEEEEEEEGEEAESPSWETAPRTEGVFLVSDTGEAAETAYEWQAVYAVDWLEQASGGDGTVHPVDNRGFLDRLEDRFFCSRASRQGGPHQRWPFVQVFVELRTSSQTIATARFSRIVYTQHHGLPFQALLPPQSLTVMKRLDVRFDTRAEAVAQLPLYSRDLVQRVSEPTPVAEAMFQAEAAATAQAQQFLQEIVRDPTDADEEALETMLQADQALPPSSPPPSSSPTINTVAAVAETIDLGLESEFEPDDELEPQPSLAPLFQDPVDPDDDVESADSNDDDTAIM